MFQNNKHATIQDTNLWVYSTGNPNFTRVNLSVWMVLESTYKHENESVLTTR